MKIVAIIAARNEERFIGNAIRHLGAQGVATYLIDNDSTDRTREIAESLRNEGLEGIETLRHRGRFDWSEILRRKEQLHCELGAHWYVHQDADMILEAPDPRHTLAQAFADVDAAGDTAVDFDEFLFLPTGPDDEHDHDRYLDEMRHYVYLSVKPRFRIIAWKNTGHRVRLAGGGHDASFFGRKIHPQRFVLRHYISLSAAHAVRKYCDRRYKTIEVFSGWHGKRATLRASDVSYPDPAFVRTFSPNGTWDRSAPVREEPLFARAPEPPRAVLASRPAYAARTFAARALLRFPALKRLSGRRSMTDHRVALLPPPDPIRPLRNVLIVGSGRSGTSMTAGLFRNSGYFMGFDLLAASPANPHGYFEDTGVTEINNLLLRWMLGWGRRPRLPGLSPAAHRDARGLWLAAPRRVFADREPMIPLVRLMDAYARRQPFCYKDPRFAVTLPLWERFLPFGTRRIVVFRHPDRTVDSILRNTRESYHPPLAVSARWAYTSWLRNYERLLRFVDRGGPAVFVHYDDVASREALPMLRAFTNAELDASHIDATENRSRQSRSPYGVAARCRELFDRLRQRAASDRQRLEGRTG